jgi:hypothetical protein
MPSDVLLLGEDLAFLTQLSNDLGSVSRSVVLSTGPRPVRRALTGMIGDPQAVVVCLDGSENVADVRSLMGAHPGAAFLFLSEASPPRSSMAHAIRACGGQVLSRQENSIIIAAMLIAMLAAGS